MIARRIAVLTVTAGLGLALATTGCSSVQKGTAAGGALGATAGMIVSNNVSGLTLAQGAAIGGGSGATLGGLAGDAYDMLTPDDVEREIQNLRAELAARDKELAKLRAAGGSPEMLAHLETVRGELLSAVEELEGLRADRNRLEVELAQAKAGLERARGDLAAAQNDLLNRDTQLSSTKGEYDALQEAVRKAEADRAAAQRRADELAAELAAAQNQLASTRDSLNDTKGRLDTIQASLQKKQEDYESLRQELADLNVQLEQTSRGLTMTIVDQLLFTPGQADLSVDGRQLLGQIANIIETNFPGRELLIEGHTDNQPIVHSGWRSNWELGAGRALTVLHELVDQHGFDPRNLSATSFGEHRPAASNATPTGRAENRRSVIVILPEKQPVGVEQYAARL
jgi:chemotaxis protein MotB